MQKTARKNTKYSRNEIVLEIKGQVYKVNKVHRVRLHVKVPGWLLNLNALLNKKLPKFLSRE